MKKLACGVFLAVLMQGAALAQRWEVGVFGAYPRWGHPALGSLSDAPADNDTRLKGEYTVGARITLNSRGYYGHEVGYSIQRTTFRSNFSTTLADGTAFSTVLEDKIKVQQAFYNFLVYFMPAGERWRPFVTGGVQAYRFGAPHFSQWPGGGSKNYGLNWGGGLKVKLFRHALMRLDARDYLGGLPYTQLSFAQNTLPVGHIHLLEGSVGFSITF
jgi:opacity protein-like surface antigen